MEILADVLRDSKMDDASIELERSVLLRQMYEAENDSQEVVFDYLHNAAFQGTPMAKAAIGTSENVK